MKRSILVLLMICGLMLAGCAVDPRPQDVGYFSTNRAASVAQTEYNGLVVLHDDQDATVNGPVLMTAHLKTGEAIGFEVGSDQKAYAIAGKERLALPPGRYRWELTPDRGQVDWNKTNVLIVEVSVATAVIVIAVVVTLVTTKAI